MSAALIGDDLAVTSMSRRLSVGSGSRTSWATTSLREAWGAPDVFLRSKREEDEEELRWAALERLPTYDRLRQGIIKQVLENGRIVHEQVDVAHLGMEDRKILMESILKVAEDDNERFLKRLRERTDRVGIEIPKIEVRFEHLCVEGDAYVGTRALPTLLNSTLNEIEGFLGLIKLLPSKKKVVKILQDVSGIVKPSRYVLEATGNITYCGHEMSEFIPQRTSAYISQHDLHHGEMTVRETLDFAGRCLGVGTRYELLVELSRREKESGIKPDPEIDAFMKATAMAGQQSSLVTDYVLMVLGLDNCADIMVGDEMRRGISGGQKKRLTTGEMLVGPAKVFFMDEISTGLDSSTTFQINKYMRQMVHIMDVTMIISLLQPAPETYALFDEIILLSEGKIVYHGPRESVLEFFESVGFKCPERKGVADFLQEVTSKKDQEQYWFKRNEPYRYVSVSDFVRHFNSFHVGQSLCDELGIPYNRNKVHPAALATKKYGISKVDLFKACLTREWLLMKRNSFVYIFKTTQITIMSIIAFTVFFRTEMKSGQLMDGSKFYGALFFSLINVMFNGMAELHLTCMRLSVFFKQRDSLFFPAWAFALPIWLLRIPLSLMESAIWIILTYYTIGFAPAASRFFRQFLAFFGIHQMALSLFRFIAALGRTQVVANTLGTFALLVVFVFGGFIVAKDDIQPWMRWGYYISPMMYGQNAIAMNEFLDKRWSTPNSDPRFPEPTVGKVLLKARGMFVDDYMYWVCVIALFGFSVLFNICFIAALAYLNPLGDSKSVIMNDDDEVKKKKRPLSNGKKPSTDRSSASTASSFEGINMGVRNTPDNDNLDVKDIATGKRGMVLPFQPLSLAFDHVNYYVDMPAEMKSRGIEEARLQLLQDVSGAFRPGVLTALVGVTGAGKTTLMDVLAGRKTGGYIEGCISISGFPKNQATFARISGYCEQNDIHSPHVTVHESIVYSAWLRLAPDVDKETRKLLLMKRGGRVIYAGPLGQNSHHLVEYFESIAGVPKIIEGSNPATWMLEITSSAVEAQLDVDFGEIFANSDLYRHKEQDLINLLGAMYVAVMFLGGTNTSGVQSVVAIERTVFYRERAAGMYSALPYAFAQVIVEDIFVSFRSVAIETIYVAIQTFVYSLILYSMIGFHWRVDKFLWFYYYVLMCFVYFTLYGMMLVALTPGYQIAAICMSFFLTFWNLFAGFMIPRTQIPIWWRWYYWASPMSWTIYGLVTSQVGDKMDLVEIPGEGAIPVKAFLEQFLGYKYDFLGAVAVAHVGWVLLFFFFFAYGIKFLNFQRR
ncbi:hypothetical protein RHGRI_027343 [Rhododendron griersonianum]|uniref:ABC transporter domain-containing protein n=1 Tax=Rhododendron griersonianum TaxID=479676 RepID=A0AAV6IY04_9ERIC|nr:hypothetical protein RHGRI_027343 [Rhododendron griersonianum]